MGRLGWQQFPSIWRRIRGPGGSQSFLQRRAGYSAIGFALEEDRSRNIRIGYDLFQEVEHLVTIRRPSENAIVPTLEVHIEILEKS